MSDRLNIFIPEITPIAPVRRAMEIAFRFPGGKRAEVRFQQHQFIYACYEGVFHSRDVIIEGPTGLGKTRSIIAAVLPFLKEERSHRVLYLTRTVSQIDNISREIEDIKAAAGKDAKVLTSAVIYGRNQLIERVNCWSGDASEAPTCGSCGRNEREPFNEIPKLISKGIPDLVADDAYSQFVLRNRKCPDLLMQSAAQKSRIVIATHNKIFDQFWLQTTFGNLGKTIVVIDEAHNFLSDAAASPFLNVVFGEGPLRANFQDSLYSFAKGFRRSDHRVSVYQKQYEGSELVFNLFDNIKTILKTEGNVRPLAENDNILIVEDTFCLVDFFTKQDTKEALSKIERISSHLSAHGDPTGRIGAFATALSELRWGLLTIAAKPFDFFVRIDGYENSLSFYPIHPKIKTEQALVGARSVIFTSATIAPVEDVAALLGRNDALKVSIPHMFPEKNYQTFFVLGCHSSAFVNGTDREVFARYEQNTIESALVAAIESAGNRNVGLFCSSFAVLAEVVKIIRRSRLVDGRRLFMGHIGGTTYNEEKSWLLKGYQRACEITGLSASQSPKPAQFIEPFMELGKRSVSSILLGVQGGALSEGVDYKGSAMEMVINIGLPYPSSAAEFQLAALKNDYWGMLYDKEDGFDVADITYKQEAFRKLAQSIGRGHRSQSDRAVVIMMDERLLGLKNNGLGSYDFLSAQNAKKNLKLLQEPVRLINGNVVVDPKNDALQRLLNQKLSKANMFGQNDVISVEEMSASIEDFWGES